MFETFAELSDAQIEEITTKVGEIENLGPIFNVLKDDLGLTATQFLELTEEMIDFKKAVDEIDL
jgi:hypothetical protein